MICRVCLQIDKYNYNYVCHKCCNINILLIYRNIPSPNIDSDSAGHSDVVGRTTTTPAEEITPLRGPESIHEHQGEAQVAAALSADVTTLNPESAQDDVSSDIV